MDGEKPILGRMIRILIFYVLVFGLLACTSTKNSLEGLYISEIAPQSEYPDSLMLYTNMSFKLNYNSYGHILPEVIFGNWIVCGNRLFLFPENSVSKIVQRKDTKLNDSITVSVYDHNFDQYRIQTNFMCFKDGDTIEMAHEATVENNFNHAFVIHSKTCDSIKVEADELLSDYDNYYRPMIMPELNTHYTVHSRFTGAGFFTKRNFYFKKKGQYIYVQWDKKLHAKSKRESDSEVSNGYLWLEKKD